MKGLAAKVCLYLKKRARSPLGPQCVRPPPSGRVRIDLLVIWTSVQGKRRRQREVQANQTADSPSRPQKDHWASVQQIAASVAMRPCPPCRIVAGNTPTVAYCCGDPGKSVCDMTHLRAVWDKEQTRPELSHRLRGGLSIVSSVVDLSQVASVPGKSIVPQRVFAAPESGEGGGGRTGAADHTPADLVYTRQSPWIWVAPTATDVQFG